MRALDLKLEARTHWVKDLASQLGFMDCRIAESTFLEKEATFLYDWLNAGKHGEMSYMERNLDLRLDPAKLVPGAKSVVVLSYNYFPSSVLPDQGYQLSKYAYGRDYHKVIRKRLKEFLRLLS